MIILTGVTRFAARSQLAFTSFLVLIFEGVRCASSSAEDFNSLRNLSICLSLSAASRANSAMSKSPAGWEGTPGALIDRRINLLICCLWPILIEMVNYGHFTTGWVEYCSDVVNLKLCVTWDVSALCFWCRRAMGYVRKTTGFINMRI